ncbi:ML5 [Symbiodinium natans]|uniref:ML5 protein n=1 Tax=Symbiodinium natans TaxID=878477 RepID=A0A812MY89_9DINO|nr:ML5 [Symbiodinium natans]
MCLDTKETKAAEVLSMEEQVRKLDARHREQAERLQMLQKMEKQKMMELQTAEIQREFWEGEITDDEDSIGQYPSSPTSPQANRSRGFDGTTGMPSSLTLASPPCNMPRPFQTAVLLPLVVNGPEHMSALNQGFNHGRMLPPVHTPTGGSALERNMQFQNVSIEMKDGCGTEIALERVCRHSRGNNLRKKSQRAAHSDQWQDNTVTVMMRNIPPHHTQQKLVDELHGRGFEGCYDFLYLPHNFELNINVGYAFINFTEPKYASAFYRQLDGQCLTKYMRQKGKFIRVHPAQLQGYEATYDHFMRTKIGQKQDPAFSPIFAVAKKAHEGAPRRDGHA